MAIGAPRVATIQRVAIPDARMTHHETVVAGETGILVDESSPAAFADGIGRALSHRFDTAAIRRHAEQFSRARFAEQIGSLVTGTTAAPDPC